MVWGVSTDPTFFKDNLIFILQKLIHLIEKKEKGPYNTGHQNQNSLLVKRQNDITSPGSPGDWPRNISP